MDDLTLYVPAPASHLNHVIDRGSAIVGEPADPAVIVICYEGNRYGAMRDFAEMILHAADRLVTGYPTAARAWVAPSALVPVGTVDRSTRTVVEITNEPALRTWKS